MEVFDEPYQEPISDLEITITEIEIWDIGDEIDTESEPLRENYIPQDDYYQKELERRQEQKDLNEMLRERIP
jgi:hypothetical protein